MRCSLSFCSNSLLAPFHLRVVLCMALSFLFLLTTFFVIPMQIQHSNMVHVFVVLLEDDMQFKSYANINKLFESGDVVRIHGKVAVILGCGCKFFKCTALSHLNCQSISHLQLRSSLPPLPLHAFNSQSRKNSHILKKKQISFSSKTLISFTKISRLIAFSFSTIDLIQFCALLQQLEKRLRRKV